MNLKPVIMVMAFAFATLVGISQKDTDLQTATKVIQGTFLGERPSIADQIASGEFVHAVDKNAEFNPKKSDGNKVIPGKGMPLNGDPLLERNSQANRMAVLEPILTFQATSANATPTDPTGAVGPDHFVNAWNSAFRIYNKDGDPLTFAASLATIWPGESAGDPIVMYDRYADRWFISQFSFPASFLVAVSTGPDPVNDGWYTYEFGVDVFPDYPKYSIWSDGYYITANKNSGNAGNTEVVYAIERDVIIAGDAGPQMVGFPLPDIVTSGFYSPLGMNSHGASLPPAGNAPIIYLQDDSWFGVSDDHLKIWNINVDWDNPNSSTISDPQILETEDFESVLDGGSFQNITCPNGTDIDAIQATIMYMAQYRSFGSYDACVLNFVVDLDGNDDWAGIRWMEIRKDGIGEEWYVYQEGTYVQEDNHSAIVGAIAQDQFGNIGMGFTAVSEDLHPELRITGRYANDPLGTMTFEEGIVAEGIQSPGFFRYGDYSQCTIDPLDDCTFWFIGEHFNDGTRKNSVGVFKIGSALANDIGIISIDAPMTGALTDMETITITIRNYGVDDQSDFDLSYQIDGNPVVTEQYMGTLASGEEDTFSFAATGDFSIVGQTYTVWASTDLDTDENENNDATSIEVTHLEPNDIGVVAITSPVEEDGLGSGEVVTVTIENFGSADQTNFDVNFDFNGEPTVTETVTENLMGQSTLSYDFVQTIDFPDFGDYELTAYTSLDGDIDGDNDATTIELTKSLCAPEIDCTEGDGFNVFILNNVNNNSGCDPNGYGDYTNLVIDINPGATHDWTVTTGWGDQFVSCWIDFNDNFLFEASELVVDNYVMAVGQGAGSYTETIPFPVPAAAALGEHLLRAKTNWNGEVPSDPCEETTYGETEDYTVDVAVGIDENPLGDAEMTIQTLGGNQFIANLDMITTSTEQVEIRVYNVRGQQVVYNKIYPVDGKYTYSLDMSYAAKGAYLIRMGTATSGKVEKIVVE